MHQPPLVPITVSAQGLPYRQNFLFSRCHHPDSPSFSCPALIIYLSPFSSLLFSCSFNLILTLLSTLHCLLASAPLLPPPQHAPVVMFVPNPPSPLLLLPCLTLSLSPLSVSSWSLSSVRVGLESVSVRSYGILSVHFHTPILAVLEDPRSSLSKPYFPTTIVLPTFILPPSSPPSPNSL